jgi:hypothetical protein
MNPPARQVNQKLASGQGVGENSPVALQAVRIQSLDCKQEVIEKYISCAPGWVRHCLLRGWHVTTLQGGSCRPYIMCVVVEYAVYPATNSALQSL